MQKFLDGKKTYIGLIVILITMIAKEKISAEEAEQFGIVLFEFIGLLFAFYGRIVTKK